MYLNKTKRLLSEGKPVIGTFLCINSSSVAEILSRSGFDYLIVDMEHGLMDIDTASDMIMAMKVSGCTPVIRVQQNEESIINRALGAGAYGIMVPMVNSAEDAMRAVKACKYPPAGVRGVGPGHMSLFGLDLKNYLSDANEQILTILQVEHIDAVHNIEEILDVPGIDIIFVGPSDLAGSMDHLGHPEHEDVQQAIAKVFAACKRKNIRTGIYCYAEEAAVSRIKSGVSFITYGLDSRFLSLSASQVVNTIHEQMDK